MTFGERLTDLRKSKGFTRDTFAEFLSISKYTLRNYELNINEPGSNFLRQISDFFDVSIDYLMCLTDEKERISQYQLKSSEYDHIKKYRLLDPPGRETVDYILTKELSRTEQLQEQSARISELEAQPAADHIEKRVFAYYGKIAAAGISFEFGDITAGTKEYPLTDENRNADYTIGVSGDSMEPHYHDGDIVFVQKTDQLSIDDVGIFQKDNGIYIKRVGNNGLLSYNNRYNPMVDGGNVICLGKVIGKAPEA